MHLRRLPIPSSPSSLTTRLLSSTILNNTSTSISISNHHHRHHQNPQSTIQRTQPFHTNTTLFKSRTPQLPPRPTLPDSDLKHTYLKGSGPGGQKINKTSSAVQLTHIPTGIVVKSQATRSQKQNHNIARKILAEKIDFIERGNESRRAKVIELKVRRKGSADKKKRRKYRALEGGRGVKDAEGEGEGEEEGKGDVEIEDGETISEEKGRVDGVMKRDEEVK